MLIKCNSNVNDWHISLNNLVNIKETTSTERHFIATGMETLQSLINQFKALTSKHRPLGVDKIKVLTESGRGADTVGTIYKFVIYDYILSISSQNPCL